MYMGRLYRCERTMLKLYRTLRVVNLVVWWYSLGCSQVTRCRYVVLTVLLAVAVEKCRHLGVLQNLLGSGTTFNRVSLVTLD